jgi:RES domain-containing protein
VLAPLGRPFSAIALRHVPRGKDPLDFHLAGVSPDNRWNEPGTPALYLAADLGVCSAENARHLAESPFGAVGRTGRDVYAIDVILESTIDLREESARQATGLDGPVSVFLDRARCRAAASIARKGDSTIQAVVVPSMAFLDDFNRWTLVVYLDRVDPGALISRVRYAGWIGYQPGLVTRLRALRFRFSARRRT